MEPGFHRMPWPALLGVFCWVFPRGSVPNGEVAVEDSLISTGDGHVCRMPGRRTQQTFLQFVLPLAWLLMVFARWLLPPCSLVGRKRHSTILGLCVTFFLVKSAPDFKANSVPYAGVEFIWTPLKNLFCISYSAHIASFLLLQEKLCTNHWACGLQGCCTMWCLWRRLKKAQAEQ